ncbi:hypothetical protein MHK_006400 [Candidatus Magnetomorum sp. HK-1]|nr:hypothetical protein MHK_006400 [Candidatus Magnetomorum sp. HK-1]
MDTKEKLFSEEELEQKINLRDHGMKIYAYVTY